MKVLIADDEPLFITVLENALKNLGHSVSSASNGKEALNLWKKEEIPLVITDWLMPEMTGIELCTKIRKEKREFYTYIIILTGLESREAYVKGLDAGADDFMNKPLDEAFLGAKLRVAERIINLNHRVEQLETLLPICAWCKKIHTEQSQWTSLEIYVKTSTNAKITHTICPDCAKKYFNSGN